MCSPNLSGALFTKRKNWAAHSRCPQTVYLTVYQRVSRAGTGRWGRVDIPLSPTSPPYPLLPASLLWGFGSGLQSVPVPCEASPVSIALFLLPLGNKMFHTYKKRFEFLFLTMCVYVCPCVGMHKGVQVSSEARGEESPGTGVTDTWKLAA